MIKKLGYLTFPVAAAAYGKKGQLLREDMNGLTHSYNPREDKVLCGKVRPGSILEDYSFETASAPTCSICLKRDGRFDT